MHKQQGFSLLEVLVTLVIISFGLLGIAGALITSMKNNQSSTARTQAMVLANNIIDSMRANRIAAETDPSPYNLELGAIIPTGDTIALKDLTQWRAALAAAMPAGTGSVKIVNTSPAGTSPPALQVTVVVQWDDSRASTDARGTDAEIQAARSAATTTVGKVAQQITVQTRLWKPI